MANLNRVIAPEAYNINNRLLHIKEVLEKLEKEFREKKEKFKRIIKDLFNR